MDSSKSSIPDSGPSESDAGDFEDQASPLSPKLRDKINKLMRWRIDPSLIEFIGGTSEVEGGHATVSRALLTVASATGGDLNEPKNVEGGPKSRDGNVQRKAVAVKKLKTDHGDSLERVLKLALREAGLLAGLAFTHIIKLEGFVEDLPNDRIWLVFPWEEHGNLKDFVASQDWEIPERISLITGVASGVAYLHSRSPPIHHGDLKSINVLVTSEARAVITDFGSARRLTRKDSNTQTTETKKRKHSELEFQATFCATTSTMTFTGNEYTLRWAAPELLMDEEPALSSDIWALGWIFYEVMTNSIPFENVRKDSAVIKHVVDGKLPAVTEHVRMSLILNLCSLMVKCWNLDPTKRPTAENCRNWLNWMPMVNPVPQRGSDPANARARSPQLLMKLGDICQAQDDCINASELYTEALNNYKETSNNVGMASALYGLGQVHWMQSEYSKAAASYSQALEIRTALGDKRGRSLAQWGLAKVHSDQGEYSKAIALYSEVIQISIDLDDKGNRAHALRGLSEVYRSQGDYSQAATFASEAVDIYTGMSSMFGRATALWHLAEAHRLQKKYSQATALFSESLHICTDIGDRFGTANALLCLADVNYDQDQHGEAIRLYEQAAEIFKQIGNTRNAEVASARAERSRSRLEPARAE